MVIGGIIYLIADLLEVDEENELLDIKDIDALFMVSHTDRSDGVSNSVRNTTTLILVLSDFIYFCFVMYQYRLLVRYSFSNKDIQNEAIKGNVLLFVGSLLTWLGLLFISFNIDIFYVIYYVIYVIFVV